MPPGPRDPREPVPQPGAEVFSRWFGTVAAEDLGSVLPALLPPADLAEGSIREDTSVREQSLGTRRPEARVRRVVRLVDRADMPGKDDPTHRVRAGELVREAHDQPKAVWAGAFLLERSSQEPALAVGRDLVQQD